MSCSPPCLSGGRGSGRLRTTGFPGEHSWPETGGKLRLKKESRWFCCCWRLRWVPSWSHCSLGALMIPLGDSYHYEMPLFWIQNRAVGPFPVNNPRINTISFSAKPWRCPAACICTTVRCLSQSLLWPVFCVSVWSFPWPERWGAAGASACAAAITLGFPDFALTFLVVTAGNYLLGMWTGASLLFLIGRPPI